MYLIHFILFFGLYIVLKIFIQRYNLKVLENLDIVSSSSSFFDEKFTSLMSALKGASNAFSIAHPAMHNWSFMSYIVDRWSTASYVWELWAHFVASYPGDSRLLGWIDSQLGLTASKDSGTLCLRTQLRALQRYRDPNMSNLIRKRLTECKKLASSAQNRLCAFWRSVAQGSIYTIELAALDAHRSWERADGEMRGLVDSYPNNKFVARTYTRFLLATHANQQTSHEWNLRVHKMNEGMVPDKGQKAAQEMFPRMHELIYRKDYNGTEASLHLQDSSTNEFLISDNQSESEQAASIATEIHSAIESVKAKAILAISIVMIVFAVIILAILAPLFANWVITNGNKFSAFVDFSSGLASLNNIVTYGSLIAQRFHLYKLGLKTINEMDSGENEVDMMLLRMTQLLNRTETSLRNIRKAFPLIPDGIHARNLNEIIFSGKSTLINYMGTEDDPQPVITTPSIDEIIVPITMNIHEMTLIANYEQAKELCQNSTTIHSLINIRAHSVQQLKNGSEELFLHTKECVSIVKQKTTLFVIIILVITFVFSVYVTVYLLILPKLERDKVAQCYLMLPKKVATQIAEQLKKAKEDVLGDAVESEFSYSSLQSRTQDESAVNSLVASHSLKVVFLPPMIVAIASSYVFAISIASVVIWSVYELNTEFRHIQEYTYYAYRFPLAYAYMASAIGELYAIALSDSGYSIPFVNRSE